MIACPERIGRAFLDPQKEVADELAKLKPGPKSPFGDSCPQCGGELAGKICKGCGAACSPVVDLPGCVLTAGIDVGLQPHATIMLQPHQINLPADGAGEVMFQPSSVNEPFVDFAAQLMQSIAANMGIPAAELRGESSLSSAHSMTRDYFEFHVNAPLKAYAEAMFQRARDYAFRRFAELAIYSAACEEYLRHHRRLPGSDRTARLRKKRRTRVLRWFLGCHR